MKNKVRMQRYAKQIAMQLHTLKIDEEVTVSKLAQKFLPYVPQDDAFLFDLASLLPKAAQLEGFRLESTDDTETGLPYNIPMTLQKDDRPQHLKVKCPHCGRKNAIMYIHGMPTHECFEMAERGDAALCGCCVMGGEPQYRCTVCNRYFGRPAFFENYDQGVEFCELVPSFHYLYGQYSRARSANASPYARCYHDVYALEMCYTGKDYQVRLSHPFLKPNPALMAGFIKENCIIKDKSVFFTLSCEKFEQFINQLYRKTMLTDWEPQYTYHDSYIFDDTIMEMTVGDQHYRCVNDWPPYFNELQAVINEWFAMAGFQNGTAPESSLSYGYSVRDGHDASAPVLIRYRYGAVETFDPHEPGEWRRTPTKDSILWGNGDFVWYDNINEEEVPAAQERIREYWAKHA